MQYNDGGSFGGASGLYYDDANNWVGIGTTSPKTMVDAEGRIRAKAHNTSGGSPASGSGFEIFYSSSINAGFLFAIDRDAGGAIKPIRIEGSEVQFWSGNNLADDVQTMTVTDTYQVGIGTTSPTSGYKLDIDGATYSRDGITMDTGNLLSWDDTNDSYIQVSSNNMFLSGYDKVTVNTLNDSYAVTFEGDVIDGTNDKVGFAANVELRQGVSHAYTSTSATTYSVLDTDYYVKFNSSATGKGTYTLPTTTTPTTGKTIKFKNETSLYTLKVGTSTTTLITLSAGNNCTAIYNGSAWEIWEDNN
jgi:hypothetical protein